MGVEVWVRNPDNCIRELLEVGHLNIAWDRGYLVKRRLDPLRWAATQIGSTLPWRMLMIGEQGTVEIDRDHPPGAPLAVYPTWEYGEMEPDLLEEFMAHPVGQNPTLCGDMSLPPDERPVLGQQHLVVVTRPPMLTTGVGRGFVRLLLGLIEDYPEARIYMHGFYSYAYAFGHSWSAIDIDPRFDAQKGNVWLPNGRHIKFEKAAHVPQWVEVCGMHASDLDVPRNRCMFNVRSALWAAEHYQENLKFKVRGLDHPDVTSAMAAQATTLSHMSSAAVAIVGDRLSCDHCSLSDSCKYFRDGSVCSVPGSEGIDLARHFKTRDSSLIIEGLGDVLAVQAERFKEGRGNEIMDGELDGEVTKLGKVLFEGGVKLAKLVDPALAAAGAPRTQVNIGIGAAPTQAAMAAQAVQAIEALGYDRSQITPEVLGLYVAGQLRPAIPALEVPGRDA